MRSVVLEGILMFFLRGFITSVSATDLYSGTQFVLALTKHVWVPSSYLTVTPVGEIPCDVWVTDRRTNQTVIYKTIWGITHIPQEELQMDFSCTAYSVNATASISVSVRTTSHNSAVLPLKSWGTVYTYCSLYETLPVNVLLTHTSGTTLSAQLDRTISNKDNQTWTFGTTESVQITNIEDTRSNRSTCFKIASEGRPLAVITNTLNYLVPETRWDALHVMFNVKNASYAILNGNSSSNDLIVFSSRSPNNSISLTRYARYELNASALSLVAIATSTPTSVYQFAPSNTRVPSVGQLGNCYVLSSEDVGGFVYVILERVFLKSLALDGESAPGLELCSVQTKNKAYVTLKIGVQEGHHQLGSNLTSFMVVTSSGEYLQGITSSTCDFIRHENDSVFAKTVLEVDVELDETASGNAGDETTLGPAIMAIIISLSSAVCLVIICIIGFIVMEVCCRRGNEHRNAKVTPFTG